MDQKEIRIRFQEISSVLELEEGDRKLVEEARRSALTAYAPYSNFFVGASLELENGQIINGNNQENAAYPSGLCAERVALFYANAAFPDQSVKALAVSAFNSSGLVHQPVSPCGSCRQVFMETEYRFGKPIRIILDGKNKILIFDGIENLLPLSFKPDSLK